jgi:hypothetical protein
MTDIQLALTDESYARLREVAASVAVDPEDLLRASLVDLIGSPAAAVGAAVDYVLRKNDGLFGRLA